MNKVKRLLGAYSKYIAIPWRTDAAAAQRVIFCVYDESDELRLRSSIEEFEIATKENGHNWAVFDLTDSFAQWLCSQKYVESYFQKPHLLATLYHKYLEHIIQKFIQFLDVNHIDESCVVAIKGVGSLFGFLRVKEVVEKLAPNVQGRLLVFFPGSYEDNNYRLLDSYDGWGYLAVPITADKVF